MLMMGTGMLRSMVIVMVMVRVGGAVTVVVMFVPRLGRYFALRAAVVMQKRMTAANNHRHHGIASSKQTGQTSAERRHMRMTCG